MLDRRGCVLFADALDDTPETVIPVHLPGRGLCQACVAGDPGENRAAIAQGDFSLSEPRSFGPDPKILWELLNFVSGWDCVNVPAECASALGRMIEQAKGVSVRCVDDVYFALTRSPSALEATAVRRLTPDEIGLLECAPPELQGAGFKSILQVLREDFVACAVVSGHVVAIARTSAISDLCADMGVSALEEHHCRGYASAAACIVGRCIQETGRTPARSTSTSNAASIQLSIRIWSFAGSLIRSALPFN